MKSVVVTGVSTGIGWGVAKVLAGKGVHVFGSVRKTQDGDRLKAQFGDMFTPLLFDVTDQAAVGKAAADVRTALKGETLFGLVNNAGIAVSGPLLLVPIDDVRRQLEVNVIGPVIVTQAFAPLLGIDRELHGKLGRIVMMSSDSGKMGYPFLGPYVASKHALEGLSESLRRELMLFGIDVILMRPGFVVSAIWDKAEEVDISPYMKTPYATGALRFRKYALEHGRKGYPPEKLGLDVWQALTEPKPKTHYEAIQGKFMNWTLPNLLPKRTVDKFAAKELRLMPEE
jgi:NAD(P)-dependent dehydrogenase (short-subunit alcohol dehydrogenase family)